MKRFSTSMAMLIIMAGNISAETIDNLGNEPALPDTGRVVILDEVSVVSSPKESFALRLQPLSSTTFGTEAIEVLRMRDLRDLSVYVPSFTMPAYGTRITSAMYVRGIGSRVNSPAVGVYIDGVPVMSKSAFNQHIYGVSLASVLRGPQGTLYGQNNEGGLVRITTLSPFDNQGTDITLGGGTHGYRNAEVAHRARLSDRAAIAVAGFYNGQNGFFRNQTTGERADNIDEAGGRLQLMLRPTNRWTAALTADYQYTHQNGFPYGIMDEQTGETAQPETNRQGNYRRNSLITALNLGYEGTIADFTSVTSYQYLKDYMLMDQDYLPEDFMHLEQRQLQNSLTQEFTLRSKQKDWWRWTTGAFFSASWLKTWAPVYFDEALTSPIANAINTAMYNAMVNSMAARMMQTGMPREAAMAAAAVAIERAGGVSMDVEMGAPGVYRTPGYNLAFFHESNFYLTPRFVATLGLRYDYNHVGIDYASAAYMAMTANVMGTEATYTLSSALNNKVSNDFNQLLPKFGLRYDIDERGSNVYLTAAKGYRAGGFNIQMFSDILQTELNANRDLAMRGDYDVPHDEESYRAITKTIEYKPETSWNYELGTHLNLLGGKIMADISTFYMQVRNQQLSVMAGNYGFGRMMVNAGKSYSCGAEVALSGTALGERLSWMASYSYTHAMFKEYTDSKQIDGKNMAVSYADNRVPFVPEHSAAAAVDYTMPLSAAVSLRLGVNAQGMGKTYWNEANTVSQKFYATLGAHADVVMSNITVSLWGRNLTNTRFNTFAVESAATGTRHTFAQRGNPLQVGADLRLHF